MKQKRTFLYYSISMARKGQQLIIPLSSANTNLSWFINQGLSSFISKKVGYNSAQAPQPVQRL
jgi:hypothetical protein